MNIKTKQFQILTDINLVWNFMTDIYDPYFANGVAAPFFEYALTSKWMDKEYLHLNRLWMAGDIVVGFVFTEAVVTSVFFNLRPGYEGLADEMVEYAQNSFPDLGGERELVIFSGQEALIRAAEKEGYKVSYENADFLFDFRKSGLSYDLPEGFHFVDPLKCDLLKLAKCTWNSFNAEELGPFKNWNIPDSETPWNPHKAYTGVVSSAVAPPHATHEYNVIIADENEDYVCFSGMWWVPENKLAYMEPLCTVPEYRRRGLAAAALTQHYRRLKVLGAEYMTGGGDDFYRKVGYGEGIHWLHWKKRRGHNWLMEVC